VRKKEAAGAAGNCRSPALSPGGGGKVAYLHTRDSKELKKTDGHGASAGTAIPANIAKFPLLCFQLGYTQFAVDKKIADEIFVKLSPGTS